MNRKPPIPNNESNKYWLVVLWVRKSSQALYTRYDRSVSVIVVFVENSAAQNLLPDVVVERTSPMPIDGNVICQRKFSSSVCCL